MAAPLVHVAHSTKGTQINGESCTPLPHALEDEHGCLLAVCSTCAQHTHAVSGRGAPELHHLQKVAQAWEGLCKSVRRGREGLCKRVRRGAPELHHLQEVAHARESLCEV